MDKEFIKLIIVLAYRYYKSKPSMFFNSYCFWAWYVGTSKNFRQNYEFYALKNKDNILVKMAVAYYFSYVVINYPYMQRTWSK